MISIPYKNRSMCSQLIEFQQGKKNRLIEIEIKTDNILSTYGPLKAVENEFFYDIT